MWLLLDHIFWIQHSQERNSNLHSTKSSVPSINEHQGNRYANGGHGLGGKCLKMKWDEAFGLIFEFLESGMIKQVKNNIVKYYIRKTSLCMYSYVY